MPIKNYPLATLTLNETLRELMEYVEGSDYQQRREIFRRFRPSGLAPFIYKFRALIPPDRIDEPNRVFNDRSIENLRDILVGSVMRLSCPADFNDPFDMAAKLSVAATEEHRLAKFNRVLDERGVTGDQRRDMMRALMNATVEDLLNIFRDSHVRLRRTAGVISFAGDPFSTLMWSHYARHHEGVCLQFDRARDFPTLAHAVRVDYEPDLPLVNWIIDAEEGIKQMLLRKDPCWSYENEYRIVLPEQAGKYVRFRPEALRAVIYGCKAGDNVIAAVESLLAERAAAKLPDVERYTAALHESRYALIIDGLEVE
jgi:hypothetical protein